MASDVGKVNRKLHLPQFSTEINLLRLVYFSAIQLGDYIAFSQLREWRKDSLETSLKAIFDLVKSRSNSNDRHLIAHEVLLFQDASQMNLMKEVDGYTVLSHACKNGLHGVVKVLLRASPSKCLVCTGAPNPIWIVANYGYPRVLRTLLENCNAHHRLLRARALDGTTPLMMAIAKGNKEALNTLKSYFPEEDILSIILELGKDNLLENFHMSKITPDMVRLAIQSENAGLVQQIYEALPEQYLLNSMVQTHSARILTCLGRPAESATSPLTELSLTYPQFNEDICTITAPKLVLGQKELSIKNDLRPLILDKFCCINPKKDTLNIAHFKNLLPCNDACMQ